LKLDANESSFQAESRWVANPKQLRPTAQGCRFGYPGFTNENDFFNRNAVASSSELLKICRNRVAVGITAFLAPRVAEAATLGFES
jgi:hypothetical protein